MHIVFLAVACWTTGCQQPRAAEREVHGKTYYIDGAGNWGFGSVSIRHGLENAGYEGDVEYFRWTSSFVPLLDQLNVFDAARRAGQRLARRIEDYRERHPNGRVNIIGLSAGTGVAVWACESLSQNCRVDNVVLLGSSLSCHYDMGRALRHIRGRVHVYHSRRDAVLKTVNFMGTIDGHKGVACAGQVGLQAARRYERRIRNIRWSPKWKKTGWTGGHTDCVKDVFVQQVLARHVVPRGPARQHPIEVATASPALD